MYSGYLFDFDYTLGDATNGIADSVNFALEQMRQPICRVEDIRKTVGMHLSDTYTYLTKDYNQTNKTRFAQLFKQRADVVMLENTKLFTDTETVLSALKSNNLKTAIVTTKYHYRITQILDKYNITHLIDVIVGGEDVVHSKPHPEPVEKALNLMNEKPQNCVYIGDSIIDAETAFNAQLDFIAVTTGTTHKEEFDKFPKIGVIPCLSDLIKLINNKGGINLTYAKL